MDLGIVPAQFLIVGEIPAQANHPIAPKANCASFSQDTTPLDCNCPRQAKPPPLPTSLPY